MDKKKFGWAYLGCGGIANTTAKELVKADDQQIVAVWNRTYERAERFVKKYGGAVYRTAEEAINAPGVDCIYIALTADKHFEYMRLCIENHKPVLCEKPFTVNAKEAEEIMALAQKEGVYVSEAMWTWHNAPAQTVKSWLQSDRLGTVQEVTCSYSFPMLKFSKNPRLTDPMRIGGALMDIGVYAVRYCYELFGVPREIQCAGRLDHGVDLGENVTFQYDGFSAKLQISLDRKGGEYVDIKGTKGHVRVPMFHVASRAIFEDAEKETFSDSADRYAVQFRNVAREIQTGKTDSEIVPLCSSVECMKLLDECRRQMGLLFPCEMERTPEGGKIKAISHLGFNCRDIEKSIAFYRDILGCKEKFTLTYGDMVADIEKQFAERNEKEPMYLKALRRFADRKWSVYMQWTDESFIELFYAMGASKPRIPGQRDLNYTHYSLEVTDIRAFRREIEARGGAPYIDSEITLGLDHTWQFWMHDPDGNKFEIMEYTPESMQLVGR